MRIEQLEILENISQFPRKKNGFKASNQELLIAKNDPKNSGSDHWWCSYGDISLSGYYSLPKMLSDLADECLKHGYAESENVLLDKK